MIILIIIIVIFTVFSIKKANDEYKKGIERMRKKRPFSNHGL